MTSTIKLPENLIEEKISPSKIAMGTILALLTIACMIAVVAVDFGTNSYIAPLLICLIIVGVILSIVAISSPRYLSYTPTHSPLVERTIEFPHSNYAAVKEALAAHQWERVRALCHSGEGAIVKLELIYTKDRSFAAYQLFHYVAPYYEPCSEVVYLDRSEVAKIALS